VVSVATTSGMREIATTTPFANPAAAPHASTTSDHASDCWKVACCIRLAESTFATAICDPIERSMPPLMTTIACAAAASASGSAPSASVWISKGPKSGWTIRVSAIAAPKSAGMPSARAACPSHRSLKEGPCASPAALKRASLRRRPTPVRARPA
jgi:hypothetical protein